ncbi:MAG: XRE family transcriptional regulator [Chitinophagaceae bacterium]|nr:MAG: XRE family transcriptional regulator [Chitinophagaceae bacterium]
MSIHIGNLIHEIIKKRGIKALAVAGAINVSESSVYKIYHRETIDIDKLIRFSQFLDVNLFLPYFEQEPLKSMFHEQVESLDTEVKRLQSVISQKEQRITELEKLNHSNEKMIGLLEELQGKYSRSEAPGTKKKK